MNPLFIVPIYFWVHQMFEGNFRLILTIFAHFRYFGQIFNLPTCFWAKITRKKLPSEVLQWFFPWIRAFIYLIMIFYVVLVKKFFPGKCILPLHILHISAYEVIFLKIWNVINACQVYRQLPEFLSRKNPCSDYNDANFCCRNLAAMSSNIIDGS